MQLSRRSIVAFAAASVLAGAVHAQAWPSKPVRVVVPFPAGGGTDLIARELTNKVAKSGYTFIVDNKPGSGGNLGVDAAAKAPADGYTFVLGQTSNLAINPTLYAKLPYDPLKDLTPVSMVASAPLVIVVGADSKLQDARRCGEGGQGAARQHQLRDFGQRHRGPPRRRVVPEGRGHQAHAYPLQGRGAGRHRRDQRAGAAVRVVHPHAHRPHQERQDASRRRHVRQARRRPAAGADDCRVRVQGLRGCHMVWHPGPCATCPRTSRRS